jgi:hypothetical protein
VSKDGQKSLSDLLAEEGTGAQSEIFGRSRELANEASSLAPEPQAKLLAILEEAWPSEGFGSLVTLGDDRGYAIAWAGVAWLSYGPALEVRLSPSRWTEVATSGAGFGLEDWLRDTWQPETAEFVVANCTSDQSRIWEHVISSIPSPLPDEVVEALTARLRTFDEPHRFELMRILDRLRDEERLAALQSLAESSQEIHDAARTHLAALGVDDELRVLLDELRRDLAEGTRRDRESLRWLFGAARDDYVEILFECLVLARRLDSDPFGPDGVIESVLASIGGERVIEGYERLIGEPPFEGAQFLRYAQDRVKQAELERAAAEHVQNLADDMGVPLLSRRNE